MKAFSEWREGISLNMNYVYGKITGNPVIVDEEEDRDVLNLKYFFNCHDCKMTMKSVIQVMHNKMSRNLMLSVIN